ncbi:hypothetical protein MmiAt1_14920 [Methanimicrococcus sp. At1]|uniref:GHMP kinase C-terminal domain-containing protein n=1 Tax=Methanimicrococcus hacksteinii TaxID=3028293 RepID=A0ABU3VR64_9EURY|nr:hypothetical protein [Methanimicrococcus sp. At1]MDV0445891.1 hypothetical protein [Methanimicrococcus sp. At1]
MKLNGLIYCSALHFSPEPAISCMEICKKFDTAAGLSGTGPSFTALFPRFDSVPADQKEDLKAAIHAVQESWKSQFPNSRIYETKTCNKNALKESRRFSKYMKSGDLSLETLEIEKLQF